MPRKPAKSSSPRSPFAPSSVGPEDLATARREALLQLKIGRAAHVGAIVVSAALALDAIVLLFVFTGLPNLAPSDHGLTALEHSYFLILPVAAGLVIGVVALASKWGEFQFWPWEAHFSTNVGAFLLDAALAVVLGLRIAGVGALGSIALYPLFVPLGLVGISAALLGVVLTWRPWGSAQWIAAIAAAAPIATSALLWVHPTLSSGSAGVLAVAYLVSAILYQTSGSFLHLVSSGTAPHEEAVVLSGQHRIVRLADEVRQRDEAVRYREAALVKREADVESAETALRRQKAAFADEKGQLDRLEEEDRVRAEALATRERELAGKEAALEAKGRSVEEKAQEVDLRREQLARQSPELAAREQRLAQAEGELARRDAELKHRSEEVVRREAAATEADARLASRRKEIDQKTTELLRREGEVAAKERPAPPSGAARAPASGPAATDLAAREAKLQHLKSVLDEQNLQLGRRAKEVAESAKTSEAALRQIVERQSHLAARESALSQREGDLDQRLKVADERRMEFETALRDYQHRLDELGRQQVAAAQKAAETDRVRQSVADREKTLGERESRLREAAADLDRREGDVILRERSVDADAAEVSLRRQGMGQGEDLPFAGLLAMAAAGRAEGPAGPASSRGPGRRRAPAGEAMGGPLPADPDSLSAPSTRKYPDRLPSGTPRLDDLLLGGIPPKSHVVLVGDAFSGKEILLYAFVAEGLKRGEPVILVTSARSSAEISESLGTVLPQFREYEQMGRVTWIDAAGAGATEGPHRLVAKSSDDRAGILTSLVQAAKAVEGSGKPGPFRVGFFGLSAVLAHADERASFSFLQNVVGILKPRNALAMYALEAGALTEAQVESLLGRMDGAIVFREERDRTYLSVKGFGDVATRDWVEVRATGRSLVIGSFALERIR